MATYQEAFSASVDYFDGDELAAGVYFKYALTTPQGDVLEPTPEYMHRRLAKEFARIEKKYPNPMSEEEIFELFDKFKYVIPQGSPMSAIGNPYRVESASNCFVVESPYDSYGGILKADQELVQISKRRGGVGLDISTIRPKGVNTSNAARTTDGIGVFMERFSNSIREVGQNGRRGALMITINVHHPEIRTFINIKKDLKKVNGANISVKLTDEFMAAVITKSKVQLRWPVDSDNPKITVEADAEELWNEICQSAWQSAEPGLLFWDAILQGPADAYEEYKSVSTNPCSEIPLCAYDSCRLMVINITSFVKNPFQHESIAGFDFEKFAEVVQKSQRLMDDLIDIELEQIDKIIQKINSDPEPEEVKKTELDLWCKIWDKTQFGRRTGLGITGLGDTLAALGLTYGSNLSIEMTDKIYKCLAINAYKSSCIMAKERGRFTHYREEVEQNNEFVLKLLNEDKQLKKLHNKYGRRNIALTTTAPVGSVSMLTQTTSGIEPAFLLQYKRRRKINPGDLEAKIDFVDELGDKWQEYDVYHHWYKKWLDLNLETKNPYERSTSAEVDWVASVKIQAAAQKWICHGISKTCNIPNDASVDLVKEIYMTAWESGCKGFTVYRDGCRNGVLVSNDVLPQEQIFNEHSAPKRPKQLNCDIYQMTVDGEKWSIFVGLLDGKPYEVMGGLSRFVNIPKRVKQGKIIKHNGDEPVRYDLHYDFEKDPEDETVIRDLANCFHNPTNSAFTRIISLALRHGASIQYVVEQLIKGTDQESNMFSLSKGLSRVLKGYIKDGTKTTATKKCQQCGNTEMVFAEGCIQCKSCGWGKCG